MPSDLLSLEPPCHSIFSTYLYTLKISPNAPGSKEDFNFLKNLNNDQPNNDIYNDIYNDVPPALKLNSQNNISLTILWQNYVNGIVSNFICQYIQAFCALLFIIIIILFNYHRGQVEYSDVNMLKAHLMFK